MNSMIQFVVCQDECLAAQRCINTNNKIECSVHGKCFYDVMGYYLSNKTQSFQNCICDDGWTNLTPESRVKCCYQKKSQYTAFALEIVIGFGLGHFYIGKTAMGFLKLISSFILCCGGCTIVCCMCYKKENNSLDEVKTVYDRGDEIRIRVRSHPLKYKILNCVVIFSALVYIIWQITDAFLFGLNLLTDGNGIELDPW
jgi:hypothetical protein